MNLRKIFKKKKLPMTNTPNASPLTWGTITGSTSVPNSTGPSSGQNGFTSFPNTTSTGGSGSYGGTGGYLGAGGANINPNVFTTGFAQTIEKEYCELCGGEIGDEWVMPPDDVRLCNSCAVKLQRDLIKKSIPKNSKVHCATCFKHIKACKCPSTEDLRKMSE